VFGHVPSPRPMIWDLRLMFSRLSCPMIIPNLQPREKCLSEQAVSVWFVGSWLTHTHVVCN
jgi:hypothetical protein